MSKIESLRKDVECVFGILKGRWASLDKGFEYRDLKTCGHIFLTCAVLHNMMLSAMVREGKPPRLQRIPLIPAAMMQTFFNTLFAFVSKPSTLVPFARKYLVSINAQRSDQEE